MGSVESTNQIGNSEKNNINISGGIPRPLATRSSSSISLSSSQGSFSRMSSLGSLPTNSGSSSPYYNNRDFLEDEERIKAPVYNLKNHMDDILLLREEFRLLDETALPCETSEGDKKHNTVKNRYTNILPVNSTRVVLKKVPEKEGSDYINANFIDGNYEKQFICTQGPLPNTFVDFWRMIWEYRCSIIVMLSKEAENCRIKCDRYWPEKGNEIYSHQTIEHHVGKFNVELVDSLYDSEREITIRNLKLTNTLDGEVRYVSQFQYEGWPDHNIPDQTQPFRDLLHLINERQNRIKPASDKNCPIVVHCSAGVGRTGTFCTAVIMMKKLDHYFNTLESLPIDQVVHPFTQNQDYQKDTLDLRNLSSTLKNLIYAQTINSMNQQAQHQQNSLSNSNSQDDYDDPNQDPKYAIKDKDGNLIDFNLFHVVLKLREQRPGMVQQLEQYIFCYKTILDEINDRFNLKLGYISQSPLKSEQSFFESNKESQKLRQSSTTTIVNNNIIDNIDNIK
ncbi:hypothetical protein DICPUDRAFT_43829 [Dictyostelium purpureum]|uniref:protein-tyrosine-phosphatase n=1 Tax=Dictyostelium purpureum TaxID=5786 RepID=F1A4W4_DICPU|nr:uncharacterized protein DICPUDRAFT_43829 [Dictyostelium purpureum]EGC28761.1 hypothetical protein DICPUDRAFT_43829 [Dictyostelium purpureum]|eukprot:XP_003294708.1 hypothetical protein DICPUDRAFT_43829 [Dictyostelium purpureum]